MARRRCFDDDLAWFYREAAGEMGVRAIPIEPSTGSGTQRDDGPSDRMVAAATRYRRIAEALWSLPHEHQRALRLVHTGRTPGQEKRFEKLGDAAPVAFDLVGHDAAIALLKLSGKRACRDYDQACAALAKLRQQAEAAVAQALKEFHAARSVVQDLESARKSARRRDRVLAILGEAA
jgi:hypothetical protein